MDERGDLPEGWLENMLEHWMRTAGDDNDRQAALWYEALDEAERRINAAKPRINHSTALAIVQEEMATRDVPYPTVLAARFAEMTRRPVLYPFTRAGRRLFTLRYGLPPRLRNPPQPSLGPVSD